MARLRTHSLPLLLIFAFLTYMLFGLGIAGYGELARLQPFTLGICILGAVYALIQHLRGRWQFYYTPLAPMVILWVAAIGISLIANPHVWRMGLEASWHVGLNVAVMAFFTGLLVNRAVSRETVEEAFLLTGIVMMAIGYFQVVLFISQGEEIPRLASLMGSPNWYVMLLILIAMLSIHRAFAARNLLAKLALGTYALAALGHLWLTGSRGGQLGFLVALCVYGLLWLFTPVAADGSTPYSRLDRILRKTIKIRLGWFIGVAIVIGVVVGTLIVTRTAFDSRIRLYTIAVQLFSQNPLTGIGLYSFGERSIAYFSAPPIDISVNAHSVVFNVLAELGILGIVALAYSVTAGIRSIINNRRVLSGQHLRAYDGAVAALVGLSIHHLFDMSLQYVALLVVIFITLVITPVAPVRIDKPIVRRASVASITLLSIGLLLGALWHIPTNSQYLDFIKSYRLQQAEGSVDYVDLMREMQSFINADPENRVYRIQYAVLAGEYAYQTNNNDDITIAINAHQTVLQQIPQFSIVWSNLAGLYWQAGEIDAAKEAARNAMNYAEDWPVPRWQYASLSGSWQYPWHLDQLYWRYTKGSLQFMYLHDITEPLILPQVADSLTVPSDTLQRIAMNGILAVMGSGG
ncbi:MAG: O-antigen ligase family protein [Anaerolineae bacterium]|nr:O-antigen ligase family protein [Anaerolineae bacterium]